eukprot:2505281-Lingulodinium_polyedra.AAC.1
MSGRAEWPEWPEWPGSGRNGRTEWPRFLPPNHARRGGGSPRASLGGICGVWALALQQPYKCKAEKFIDRK